MSQGKKICYPEESTKLPGEKGLFISGLFILRRFFFIWKCSSERIDKLPFACYTAFDGNKSAMK